MSFYKSVYKNLFLIRKNFYLILFGWFLFETKAKKSFLYFPFDIYFKANLVVPLGFKKD